LYYIFRFYIVSFIFSCLTKITKNNQKQPETTRNNQKQPETTRNNQKQPENKQTIKIKIKNATKTLKKNA
jgi:hypothetical protein